MMGNLLLIFERFFLLNLNGMTDFNQVNLKIYLDISILKILYLPISLPLFPGSSSLSNENCIH